MHVESKFLAIYLLNLGLPTNLDAYEESRTHSCNDLLCEDYLGKSDRISG